MKVAVEAAPPPCLLNAATFSKINSPNAPITITSANRGCIVITNCIASHVEISGSQTVLEFVYIYNNTFTGYDVTMSSSNFGIIKFADDVAVSEYFIVQNNYYINGTNTNLPYTQNIFLKFNANFAMNFDQNPNTLGPENNFTVANNVFSFTSTEVTGGLMRANFVEHKQFLLGNSSFFPAMIIDNNQMLFAQGRINKQQEWLYLCFWCTPLLAGYPILIGHNATFSNNKVLGRTIVSSNTGSASNAVYSFITLNNRFWGNISVLNNSFDVMHGTSTNLPSATAFDTSFDFVALTSTVTYDNIGTVPGVGAWKDNPFSVLVKGNSVKFSAQISNGVTTMADAHSDIVEFSQKFAPVLTTIEDNDVQIHFDRYRDSLDLTFFRSVGMASPSVDLPPRYNATLIFKNNSFNARYSTSVTTDFFSNAPVGVSIIKFSRPFISNFVIENCNITLEVERLNIQPQIKLFDMREELDGLTFPRPYFSFLRNNFTTTFITQLHNSSAEDGTGQPHISGSAATPIIMFDFVPSRSGSIIVEDNAMNILHDDNDDDGAVQPSIVVNNSFTEYPMQFILAKFNVVATKKMNISDESVVRFSNNLVNITPGIDAEENQVEISTILWQNDLEAYQDSSGGFSQLPALVVTNNKIEMWKGMKSLANSSSVGIFRLGDGDFEKGADVYVIHANEIVVVDSGNDDAFYLQASPFIFFINETSIFQSSTNISIKHNIIKAKLNISDALVDLIAGISALKRVVFIGLGQVTRSEYVTIESNIFTIDKSIFDNTVGSVSAVDFPQVGRLCAISSSTFESEFAPDPKSAPCFFKGNQLVYFSDKNSLLHSALASGFNSTYLAMNISVFSFRDAYSSWSASGVQSRIRFELNSIRMNVADVAFESVNVIVMSRLNSGEVKFIHTQVDLVNNQVTLLQGTDAGASSILVVDSASLATNNISATYNKIILHSSFWQSSIINISQRLNLEGELSMHRNQILGLFTLRNATSSTTSAIPDNSRFIAFIFLNYLSSTTPNVLTDPSENSNVTGGNLSFELNIIINRNIYDREDSNCEIGIVMLSQNWRLNSSNIILKRNQMRAQNLTLIRDLQIAGLHSFLDSSGVGTYSGIFGVGTLFPSISSSSDVVSIESISYYRKMSAHVLFLNAVLMSISSLLVTSSKLTVTELTMSRSSQYSVHAGIARAERSGASEKFMIVRTEFSDCSVTVTLSNYSDHFSSIASVASTGQELNFYIFYHSRLAPSTTFDQLWQPSRFVNNVVSSNIQHMNYVKLFESRILVANQLTRNITFRNCSSKIKIQELNNTINAVISPQINFDNKLVLLTRFRMNVTVENSSADIWVNHSIGQFFGARNRVLDMQVLQPETLPMIVNVSSCDSKVSVLRHEFDFEGHPFLTPALVAGADLIQRALVLASVVGVVFDESHDDTITDAFRLESNALNVTFVDASNHSFDASSSSYMNNGVNSVTIQLQIKKASHFPVKSFSFKSNYAGLHFNWGTVGTPTFEDLVFRNSQLDLATRTFPNQYFSELNLRNNTNQLVIDTPDGPSSFASFSPSMIHNILFTAARSATNSHDLAFRRASPGNQVFTLSGNTLETRIRDQWPSSSSPYPSLNLSTTFKNTPTTSLFNLRSINMNYVEFTDATQQTLWFAHFVFEHNRLLCPISVNQTTCGQLSLITSPHNRPARKLLGDQFFLEVSKNKMSQARVHDPVASMDDIATSNKGMLLLALKQDTPTDMAQFSFGCNHWPLAMTRDQVSDFLVNFNASANITCTATQTQTQTQSDDSLSLSSVSQSSSESFSVSTSESTVSSSIVPPTPTATIPLPPPTSSASQSDITIFSKTSSPSLLFSDTEDYTPTILPPPTPPNTTTTTTNPPPVSNVTAPPVEEDDFEDIPSANTIVEGAGAVSAIAAVTTAPSVVRGLTVLSLVADNCKNFKHNQAAIAAGGSTTVGVNGAIVNVPRQPVKSLPFPQTVIPFLKIGGEYDSRSPHRGAVIANAIIAPIMAVIISMVLWSGFFLAKRDATTESYSIKRVARFSSVLGRVVQAWGFTIEGSFASATFLFKYEDPTDGTQGLDVFLALLGFFIPLIALPLLFYRAHRALREPTGETRFEKARMEIGGDLVKPSSDRRAMFWTFVLGSAAWRTAAPPPSQSPPQADSMNSSSSTATNNNEIIENTRAEFELCLPMFGKSRGPIYTPDKEEDDHEHDDDDDDKKKKQQRNKKTSKKKPNNSNNSLTQILGMISARSMLFDILLTGFLGCARGYALSNPCERSTSALGGVQFLSTLALLETIILRGFISPLRNILDLFSSLTLFLSTCFALGKISEAVAILATISVVFGILSALLHRLLAVCARFCFRVVLTPETDWRVKQKSKEAGGGDNKDGKNNGQDLMHLLQSAIFSDAPIQRNVQPEQQKPSSQPQQQQSYEPPTDLVLEDDDFIDLSDLIDDNMKQAEEEARTNMIQREEASITFVDHNVNNNNNNDNDVDFDINIEDDDENAEEMIPINEFDLFDGLDDPNTTNNNNNDDILLELGEIGRDDDDDDDDDETIRKRRKGGDDNGTPIVEGEAYQAPTETESRLKRLLDELDDEDEDQIRQRKEEEERRRRRAASSKQSADELMKMLQEVLKGNKQL